MAHLDLTHPGMKPAPIVRHEIALELNRAKQLLVGAIVVSTVIVVMAAMFLSVVR